MTTDPKTQLKKVDHRRPKGFYSNKMVLAKFPNLGEPQLSYWGDKKWITFTSGGGPKNRRYYSEFDVEKIGYMNMLVNDLGMAAGKAATLTKLLYSKGIMKNDKVWISVAGIHIGVPYNDTSLSN